MAVLAKAKKWLSDFFDPEGVSPALVFVWLLIGVMFFASHDELHLRIPAVLLILLSATQLIRMALRGRIRKRNHKEGV